MEHCAFARQLRKEQTPAERLMWSMLRNRALGHKFRRQVVRGPYILDFACLEARLVIEVDGSQHADDPADAVRDAWLRQRGWCVLRFWNQEVLRNAQGVRQTIVTALPAAPSPSPRPSNRASSIPLPHRGEGTPVAP